MNARRLTRALMVAMLALSAACTTPKQSPQMPEAAASDQPTAQQDQERERTAEPEAHGHNYADSPVAHGDERAETKSSVAESAPSPAEHYRPSAPRAAAKGTAAEDSARDYGSGEGPAQGYSGPIAPPAQAPQRKERPGLATTWGEDRYAPVHSTSFVRRSSEPMASLRALYNDRTGTNVATSGGWSDPGGGGADMGAGPVSVRIEDGNGAMFERQFSGGAWHVVGERDARYVIIVANHGGARVEAVLSVDGLDVITGKGASTGTRGYIVAPYGEVRVEGFRRSDSQVAAFRFGSVSESYAARTGNARNVGVIGLALFEEQEHAYVRPAYVPPYRWHDPRVDEQYRRANANPFPASNGYAEPPR